MTTEIWREAIKGRQDTPHNDTPHNDIQLNDTQKIDVQHNFKKCDTQNYDIQCLC